MQEGRIDERTLFAWLDRNRAGAGHDASLRAITISLATLLLFRWLESAEEEAAAIAEFEGSPYQRSLPVERSLETWADIPREDLPRYLREVVVPELSAAQGSEHSLYAKRLVPGIERLSTLEPSVRTDLIERALAIDPSEPAGRLAGERLLGTVWEWQHRARKSGAGEFATPEDLASLMVQLAAPGPSDRVYDPCFGGASLLVEAARRKRSLTAKIDSELWGQMQRNGIYGRETDPELFLIGLARVVYCGIDLPRLDLGDSLESAFPSRGSADAGFDCILAAPPLGMRVPSRTGSSYPIPMIEGEGLFIQHIVESLRPGGRAVVLVSSGMLAKEGPVAKLREHLVDSNLVEQVVSLPSGVLKPHTMIAPSLLVLRKGRRSNEIRFSRQRAPKPIDDFIAPEAADEYHWFEEYSYELSAEECAKRGHDLRVRDESERMVESRIQELANRHPEIELRKLGQLCDVVAGVSFQRSATTTKREEAGDHPVGLLRVSDIAKGTIREPELYLLPGSPPIKRERLMLQPGDILLSTKGTVGKAAVVPELKSPVYAADGVAIVRPSSPAIQRDYLFGVLSSTSYRDLLSGMSTGSALRHVRPGDLRSLPIPLPPVPMQVIVSNEAMESGRDAVDALDRLVEGGEENPFSDWIEQDEAISSLVDLATSAPTSDRLRILEQASDSATRILRVVGEQPGKLSADVAGESFAWLKSFAEAAAPLRSITRIDPVQERFSLLSLARARSMICEVVAPRSGPPLADRIRKISSAFQKLLSDECQSLLKQQEVRAECFLPSEEDSDGVATVYFHNEGPFALRDVRYVDITTNEAFVLPYWDANVSVPLNLEHEFHKDFAKIRRQPPRFLIEATHLDDSQFLAECEAPVFEDDDSFLESMLRKPASESLTEAGVLTSNLGPNPYNAGSPVKNESMLYGRDQLLRLVQRQLGAKDRPNVILLEGNRRTGKTSILKRLEKGDLLPDWVVVYCSLQEAEGSEVAGLRTNDIWRLLAKNVGLALIRDGYDAPLPGDSAGDPGKPPKIRFTRACRDAFQVDYPFETFEEFLLQCLEAVAPKRIVLMLDEFDKLQEGIDAGVTSPQVPENLRFLIHEHPSFSAILTGSRRLKRLREEYWSALFGFGLREGISALSNEDAFDLVVQPVKGLLVYHSDAAEEIVRVTAGQPYLIQNLCSRVYDRVAESGRRQVDLRTVRQVIDAFVEGSEHFRHFWGCAETARRQLILSLVQRAESDPQAAAMTAPLLEETLSELRVPIPKGDKISDDLLFLREFEMIRLVGRHPNQHYEIEVPLFGRWIEEQEDYDETVRRAIEEGEAACSR